ncbi:MAG: UDP-N-acetylmuramate dehydrogenase [Clostridia bacterium]|nr:UDP-N-acetylmuramate dehydrogenase [Clostridia bacterium]
MPDALAGIIGSFSITECEFFHHLPLSGITTFRIGGPATVVAVPKTEEALIRLLAALYRAGIPRTLIGNGSNLLASDSGYRGVVIRTVALREILTGPHGLTALCGTPLAGIAKAAGRLGIGGFSSLAGIPATLGGAIFMNAGAGDDTVGERVVSVRAVPSCGGEPFLLSRDECLFSYRSSVFSRRGLVLLSATLSGPSAPCEQIAKETAEAMVRRRRSQPLEHPSAGSVFRRPPGDYAGRLIEAAGLKGMRIGNAQVSEKHAGFIVNLGGATAEDVRSLIRHVQMTVFLRFGVSLVREIEYLGEE